MSKEIASLLSEARIQYYNDAAAYGPAFRDLGYVLHNVNGTPYHPDSLTKKWRRFLERSNLPYIRFHDLHHSTDCCRGQPQNRPAAVGHSDISITLNAYTHVLPSMEQEAVDTLDRVIFCTASSQ